MTSRWINQSNTTSFLYQQQIYINIFDLYRIQQAVAASIKAIYILLGDSDLMAPQDPVLVDKVEEMPISYSSHLLGQIVNTQCTDIKLPLEFIANILNLLWKHLGCHCKVFQSHDIESIAGKLWLIVTTAPWLHFLLPDLYAEIAACLKIHCNHFNLTNKQFCTLLKLQCNGDVSHNHGTFAMAKMAKATHLLQ